MTRATIEQFKVTKSMNTLVTSKLGRSENSGYGYGYVVAVALAVVYMFNFLDRQLVSVLAEPLKRELALSDTQLGLLTGFVFAVFYTVFGIPVAMVADRWNRVRLVAIACGLWSLFSAASGLATNFSTLALARIGVGVGEAGGSPPSYSILSDYFPPEKRGVALAIYSLGVPVGSLLGIAGGAWIAQAYGWRAAFITVGLIGLTLAPLLLLIVREPVRGVLEGRPSDGPRGSVLESLLFFVRSPILVLNACSAGLAALVGYGILNWAPAYLLRVQGMSLTQLGAAYGLVAGLMMAAGTWGGGYLVDRLGVRSKAAYALVPAASMSLLIPFLIGFTSVTGWMTSLALLAAPLALLMVYLAPALTVVQNGVPAHQRATASAFLLFVLNLLGLGVGPLFVGAVSDMLAPTYGAASLGVALRWLTPFAVASIVLNLVTARLLLKRDNLR